MAALFIGLGHGQALVLCFGPGGGVSVEVSLGGGPCDGCPEVASGGETSTSMADGTGCPCVDVPVGFPFEAKPRPKSVELNGLACLPASFRLFVAADLPAHAVRRAAEPPWVAPRVALIRSVVLLV